MPSKTPEKKTTKTPPKAGEGKANALQKELQPSEELAAVVGGPGLRPPPRPDPHRTGP